MKRNNRFIILPRPILVKDCEFVSAYFSAHVPFPSLTIAVYRGLDITTSGLICFFEIAGREKNKIES